MTEQRAMSKRKLKYKTGEIGRVRVVDFLPSPDVLVPRDEKARR